MINVIPNTKHTPRVYVYYDAWGGEHHTVYLWATERPKNRVLPRPPRPVTVFRPVRQPGLDRRGRF
jgi:hypothetical protein